MDKISKTDQEWQTCLTPEEYRILREKGTERAFTGEYYNHKEEGTYTCAGCDNELFSSDTKYDSQDGLHFLMLLMRQKLTQKET